MSAKGKSPKVDKKLEAYKKAFKDVDKNNDGFITEEEMTAMLQKEGCHMSKEAVKETFQYFDTEGGDQKITFDEFCKGLDAIVALIEGLWMVFNEVDADKSGFLDRSELTKVLQQGKKKFSEEEIDAILKNADANGDNKICFDEFIAAIV